MVKTRGFRFAAFTALAASVVGAVVLFSWRDLVIAYQGYRLRGDRRYLLRILEAPETSLAGVALRRFVLTPNGGHALLESYGDFTVEHVLPELRRELTIPGAVQWGILAYDRQVFEFHLRSASGSVELPEGRDKWSLVERLQALTLLVDSVDVVCSRSSGYCFRLVRPEEVARVFGSSFGEGSETFPVRALWFHDSPDQDVARLCADLESPDAVIRHRAATEFYEDPWLARQSASVLVESLADEDRSTRGMVSSALIRIGAPAVEPLVAGLQSNDRKVAARSGFCLWQIGSPGATSALPALVDALNRPDRDVRAKAMIAICGIGPRASDLRAIMRSLDDEDRTVRRWAAKALGVLGAEAGVASSALTRALDDEFGPVRSAAAEALEAITRSKAVVR